MIRTRDGKEIYEDDIELAISDFCANYNIEDLSKARQSQWNACLAYVQRKLFRNPRARGNAHQPNSLLDYNNVEQLLELQSKYLDLCRLYSKEISLTGFSNLTGIQTQTMDLWKTKQTHTILYKNILENHEESIRNRLYDSNNIVGTITLANHDLGYSTSKVEHVTSAPGKRLLGRDELALDRIHKGLAEIALPDTSEDG